MKSASFLVALAIFATTVGIAAQLTTSVPQPRADKLSPPTQATPNRSVTVPRPEGLMPKAPAGFPVTSYAELQAPRMMVYAPNGDLFVSSPAARSITVLRDANNDGVFEARSVYAEAPAPGARQ